MAIETVFLDLRRKIDALREALQGLALTAIEDRPRRGEVLLVERLGNLVEDLCGWAEEAREAAAQASGALEHPSDLNLGRRALSVANERFIHLEYRFFGEAVAHETVGELLRFGRRSDGEWWSWACSAVQALDACRSPLFDLDQALLRAWQELGERLAARSFTVQTSNIGQQITVPAKRTNVQGVKGRVGDGRP